jgi:hypothetical protein
MRIVLVQTTTSLLRLAVLHTARRGRPYVSSQYFNGGVPSAKFGRIPPGNTWNSEHKASSFNGPERARGVHTLTVNLREIRQGK